MEAIIVGIDLGKSIFHLHGINAHGKEVFRKRFSRNQLGDFVARLPRCTIAMEACGGSHYWGRRFREFGHEVQLIAPQYVKPYVIPRVLEYPFFLLTSRFIGILR